MPATRTSTRQAITYWMYRDRPLPNLLRSLNTLRPRSPLTYALPPAGLATFRRTRITPTAPDVNLIGFLASSKGLGHTARCVADTLTMAGATVTQSVVAPSEPKQPIVTGDVATAPPINIFAINPDQLHFLWDEFGAELFDRHYNIGLWWWEQPEFPAAWTWTARLFDEIWTLSDFCHDIFANAMDVPTYKLTYPLPAQPYATPRARAADAPFTFLFSFDYHSSPIRKNAIDTVRAFRLAFGNSREHRLIIKSVDEAANLHYAELLRSTARSANVEFRDGVIGNDEMLDLLGSCDCYVSLHRSEGLGLGMAEAMALGKPVIATGWSGNLDFMSAEDALLVDYKLIKSRVHSVSYPAGSTWAQPDWRHAATLMQRIASDAELRSRLAARGPIKIAEALNQEQSARDMAARLNAITHPAQ